MNDSVEVSDPSAEEAPAPANPRMILGGVIHIVADAKTGEMNVSAPPNLAVALGLIELAKVVLVQQYIDNSKAAAQPKIVRAQPDDIRKLVRPS